MDLLLLELFEEEGFVGGVGGFYALYQTGFLYVEMRILDPRKHADSANRESGIEECEEINVGFLQKCTLCPKIGYNTSHVNIYRINYL
ncbi:MAG: hypothetical protein K2N09_00530, partial [Muribaculaceae bacterium]|nr:hypothetical protein [Muribaculaceae bacterium]